MPSQSRFDVAAERKALLATALASIDAAPVACRAPLIREARALIDALDGAAPAGAETPEEDPLHELRARFAADAHDGGRRH